MLDAGDILDDAQRQTGFADPQPALFRPNLDRLVASLNADGGLSDAGEAAVRANLVQRSVDRLSGLKWVGEYPEIADEPISDPVFLTGLPRSGTTFFQYLFDRDPRFRLIRTWEANVPSPPPGFDPVSATTRLAEETERRRSHEIKGFAAMHLLDADGPEECHAFLEQSYAASGFFNTLRAPSYFNYLMDELDFVAAYRAHKRQLQLLQWRTPQKRWALKYPNHVVAMDAILTVFPDARFVMTHRDPVQTLASISKLTLMLRQLRSPSVDPHVVGREMLAFVQRHIDRIMEFCGSPSADRVTHVDYYRLVDDPPKVMAEVHASLGIDTPSQVRTAVADWHRLNPKGSRGTNSYALETYGLDEDAVAEQFAPYMSRFDIPREQAGLAAVHA